jgi:hypothetical protein
MLNYILTIVVFIISSIVLYTISSDPKKNSLKFIAVRNILPSMVLAITVFCIIKFKDNLFTQEPMMNGNYFD